MVDSRLPRLQCYAVLLLVMMTANVTSAAFQFTTSLALYERGASMYLDVTSDFQAGVVLHCFFTDSSGRLEGRELSAPTAQPLYRYYTYAPNFDTGAARLTCAYTPSFNEDVVDLCIMTPFTVSASGMLCYGKREITVTLFI